MRSLSLMLLSLVWCSVQAHAQTPLSVCEALDASWALRGRTVTVRGYLTGSTYHGYSLYASASLRSDPCRGWNTKYFTAPAVIALADLPAALLATMRRKEAERDSAPLLVEITGRAERKWLLWIFKLRGGGYGGNGFGGSTCAAMLIHPQRAVAVPATAKGATAE